MVPVPQIKAEDLRDKYVLLDNDFLGMIFEDAELLNGSLSIIGKDNFLAVDSFTKLEFLRDVWMSDKRKKKEEFLGVSIFSALTEHDNHPDVIKENALEISRIYAHKGVKVTSSVDLLLAGTALFYENSVLVTGNKKDFPSCIFDLIGVLNFEQKDGVVRSVSFISLNKNKFTECRNLYLQVPTSTSVIETESAVIKKNK